MEQRLNRNSGVKEGTKESWGVDGEKEEECAWRKGWGGVVGSDQQVQTKRAKTERRRRAMEGKREKRRGERKRAGDEGKE